jgi:hypothetical protein
MKTLLLFLCVLSLTFSLQGSDVPPTFGGTTPGRYQLIAQPGKDGTSELWRIDTATGQCWKFTTVIVEMRGNIPVTLDYWCPTREATGDAVQAYETENARRRAQSQAKN